MEFAVFVRHMLLDVLPPYVMRNRLWENLKQGAARFSGIRNRPRGVQRCGNGIGHLEREEVRLGEDTRR